MASLSLSSLVYPIDYPDPELAGKAKGMCAVVQEWTSLWDKLVDEVGSEKKVVGKCEKCRKSQIKKDAERRVAMAEAAGQEDTVVDEDLAAAEAPVVESDSACCCLYRVLSLQEDFLNEKPMIQHYLEGRGYICVFYPKFHCEFNAIEMLWGYAKYRKLFLFLFPFPFQIKANSTDTGFRIATDGKFPTAKILVPQCLDMADVQVQSGSFFLKDLAVHGCIQVGFDIWTFNSGKLIV